MISIEESFKKAEGLAYAGEHLKAIEAYDNILTLSPSNSIASLAYYNKGWLLANIRNYSQAIEACDYAIQLCPECLPAYRTKIYALSQLGEDNKIMITAKFALQIDTHATVIHNFKGLSLIKLARCREAIEAFEQVIKIDPNDYGAHLNKGASLHRLERYAEAIESCNNAIALDSINPEAYYNIGLSLYKLNQHREALDAIQQAIDLDIQGTYVDYKNTFNAIAFESIKHLIKLENEDDIHEFDRIIEELTKDHDPDVLAKLFELFELVDEDHVYPQIGYNLIHAIESYPTQLYIKSLLSNLHLASARSSMWFISLLNGIFNHNKSYSFFLNNIHYANCDALQKLLNLKEERINEGTPSTHQRIIKELRSIVNKIQ